MTFYPSGDLSADAAAIRQAESMGFAAAWSVERQHNPFFPLTIAAKQTHAIQLGSQFAVAFPRSPMVTAQIAWDLARQSGGRFVLGLAADFPSQIARHAAEGHYDPIDRMREYVESLRAIWNTFQTGERLRYRGQHYQFRLMAPFFNPGPNDHPDIPISIAGTDPGVCQLAGEICQGLHLPLLHKVESLRDLILPATRKGLEHSGRMRQDFSITVPVLIVSGTTLEMTEKAKRHAKALITINAAASGRDTVMTQQAWNGLRDISDDSLEEIAIVAEPQEVARRIRERYLSLADRISLVWNDHDPDLMRQIVNDLRN